MVKNLRKYNLRKKAKHCKTIGCLYFTNKVHCSACASGRTQKEKQFEISLKKQINKLTKGSKNAIGDTVMDTISNLMKKDTFFKAKDVLKFCQGYYESDCWYDNPQLARPLDKLLMRVLDYWNIRREFGFNSTIHCFWNPYDGPNTMQLLYQNRKKMLDRAGYNFVLANNKDLLPAYCELYYKLQQI